MRELQRMQKSKLNFDKISNSERLYIQDFNRLLNKFHSLCLQNDVDALYEMLDEFKPYIYGQFNLEIISMLRKLNPLIIKYDKYLPKYYLYCGQAYYYLNEYNESKRYFRLAISYGIKHKKYRVVSYSIWNYELMNFNEKDIVHADQISRLISSFYAMDESLHEEYNRGYLAHLSAAFNFNQFDYWNNFLKKIEHTFPEYSKDWVDIMVLKASIYRQRKQYLKAFQMLSELYPRLDKRNVKASTIPRILREIHLLSKHFDEMNESTQVKTQLLKGYLDFIDKNKGTTKKIERIECKRLPLVSERSVFIEKAELLLKEQNESYFINIDIKANIVSEAILHKIQLKIVNEMYALFGQRTLFSYALSSNTIVFILKDNASTEYVENQIEKILSILKDQQFSILEKSVFYFTVLSNKKYEVYNYNDAQNLANALFYYELCKQV